MNKPVKRAVRTLKKEKKTCGEKKLAKAAEMQICGCETQFFR
jgi:hypothetical protein